MFSRLKSISRVHHIGLVSVCCCLFSGHNLLVEGKQLSPPTRCVFSRPSQLRFHRSWLSDLAGGNQKQESVHRSSLFKTTASSTPHRLVKPLNTRVDHFYPYAVPCRWCCFFKLVTSPLYRNKYDQRPEQ